MSENTILTKTFIELVKNRPGIYDNKKKLIPKSKLWEEIANEHGMTGKLKKN